MASTATQSAAVNADTLITVKVAIDGSNRRFKLALRDLGAHVFPQKLRFLLAIPPDATVVFERYSDSAAAFVRLDSNNTAIYKQLYRAAKAKLKLRIKATVTRNPLESDRMLSTASPATTYEAPNVERGLTQLPSPSVTSITSNPITVVPAASTTTLAQTLQASTTKFELPPVPGCFPLLNDVVPKSDVSPVTLPSRPYPGSAPGSKSLPSPLPKPSVGLAEYPGSFCIDCNHCGISIPNVHYHCGICDEGDFDLCQACVDSGILCDGDGHWLIKRFIQDGKVINSTTETIESRRVTKTETKTPSIAEEPKLPRFTRTCNACVTSFDDSVFVTCLDCEDFDLCVSCHLRAEHGHHPGHTFKPLSDNISFGEIVHDLCQPGRGRHHCAICDGCDKRIVGVRHKCLTCPDWDYCSACVQSAKHIHPGHRFAPIYEPISEATPRTQIHYGIYCDGPLCNTDGNRCYIVGDRYKCAVCHDTDFCANCEAVPSNNHNHTHPLIKFRTPVRNVSVTTLGEKGNGERMTPMGDRQPMTKSAATETTPTSTSANAATQVHTVAEVKPVEEAPVEEAPVEEAPVDEAPVEETPVEDRAELSENPTDTPVSQLEACFLYDSVPDDSKIVAGTTFDQIWTMHNSGPFSWPPGCSVRFIGGDGMLNVDINHPSSVSALASATESNVLGREVEPDEVVKFRVTLKAPPREGRAISYWRLKTAEGVPFGHKLWCDIDVVKAAPVEPETEHAKSVEGERTLEENKDADVSQTSSTMIFPKLEKESPVSSQHLTSPPPTVPSVASNAGPELEEDLESLELEEEQTDDGFLTDEEYDILDASDEEFVAEAEKSSRK